MKAIEAADRVFHIYNRANDRRELFHRPDTYRLFVAKMKRQLTPAAYILGYCIMPNHFHVLLVPKHRLRDQITSSGESYRFMPTPELSEASKRWLMGFTKSYNAFFSSTGACFTPHGNAKHHSGPLRFGLTYLHNNPVRAGLVDDPSEWEYSSFNEYKFYEEGRNQNLICDVELGRSLLALDRLDDDLHL